jgi:hypothetical protein
MIKVLIVLMMATPFVCIAQTDTAGFVVTPHIATAIGKPNGEKVSLKMNKDGGSIKSIDGRVELIIPEGALSSKTNIVIQPITNYASGGVGNAYEFEPSGTIFNKPVQLIFKYTKEELDGTLAGCKSIATQASDNKWYALENIVVDTTVQTITCNIEHFSRYAQFNFVKLNPVEAKVKVGKSIFMQITYNTTPNQKSGIPDNKEREQPISTKLNWYVNSIPNGNNTVGKLISEPNGKTFIAPAVVPDANPVAVTVKLKGRSIRNSINGSIFNDLTLVSNVTVYDKAYQISVIGIWKDLRREALGADYYRKMGVGEQIITDTSSFILHLNGNKSSITDIQNMFKDSIINRGKCTMTLLNAPIATGIIQIDGVESITVVPADPPRQPSRGITIKFKKPEIFMPDLITECKGATINDVGARGTMFLLNVGFPQTISFMENELKDYWAAKAGINEYRVVIKVLDDN